MIVRRLACATLALIVLLPGSGAASAADPAERQLLETFRQEFIAITPGQGAFPQDFMQGRADGAEAERPPRRVRLTAPFAIARYEVPQNLWQGVMGSNPSRWQGPRNSVEMTSWHECQDFCRRATALLRREKLIEPDEEVRLPTEAEWEYCARAGTTTEYSFGDDVARLDEHAWHTGNAAGNDPPVGAKRPNAWGLYDVHGYLAEWCADDWHDDYTGAPVEASAWLGGGDAQRAPLRGGSWKDAAPALTSSHRRPADKDLRDDAVGLRCVLAKISAKR
ncbi:MAG: formylglycine-generating enzyme family protein [Planctomycetaceae bacterium]|nr:formylglycine-generating enzyme family protein [Planctomycetaceae bacterium]